MFQGLPALCPGDEDHTMQALIYAAMAAATTIGVDVGWQPAPEGGLEYIIQIEPETLDQLRSGQEVVVGIRPELRDVRRYRIIVGDGPLPREALRPQAADFSTSSDVGEAAPAVATEGVNPYRTPSYSGASEAARPDLLAQANTSSADPISSRYNGAAGGEQPAETPRFITPSRYDATAGAADSATPRTNTPSTTTTNAQAYDWFSERFGGAGSINVPLLYTTSQADTASDRSNSEGWNSANPGGTANNNSNPATNSNSNNNTGGNDPRYANNNSGPVLNPPHDAGLTPINQSTNNNSASGNTNWPTGANQPNLNQPNSNQANQSGYANNPYSGNQTFPVAPAPTTQQGNPNYPYAGGNPYAGQQPANAGNPYAAGNPYSYPQQPGGQQYQQHPQHGQGTFAGNTGGAAGLGAAGAPLTFGQGTALDPSMQNTNQAGATIAKEPENKPWAFLMMTLFCLFASMGLNLYLGWNFYDARLRYLDLLDSLRRRGAGGNGTSATTARISGGSEITERYSAA